MLFAESPAASDRLVVGLMSGTSLDGVDAALVQVRGSGRGVSVEARAFVSRPYPEALRTAILANSSAETSSVVALSQLNVRLADVYADAVRAVCEAGGVAVSDLDLVGCHGQTVQHVPEAEDCAGTPVASTLQIGSPSVLANRLGVAVVGDFRLADMAHGGQGAPLVPYFDYVCFSSESETRGLLNLGGIANLTILPAGADASATRAFDTGPANMVIDALAHHFFGLGYDADGALAAQGTVDENLLADLLAGDDYLALPPPKSTGRERYGADFAARFHRLAPHDALATATAFTARTVAEAYRRFFAPHAEAGRMQPLAEILASGGGVRNATLMRMLGDALAPAPVRSLSTHGVDADAKEAICFAVLAHEYVNGVPTGVPSVTGASRAARLGVLAMP